MKIIGEEDINAGLFISNFEQYILIFINRLCKEFDREIFNSDHKINSTTNSSM